jgi:hypothetical protein
MSLPTIRTARTERRGKIPNTALSPPIFKTPPPCPDLPLSSQKNSTSVTLKKRATLAEGLGGNLASF